MLHLSLEIANSGRTGPIMVTSHISKLDSSGTTWILDNGLFKKSDSSYVRVSDASIYTTNDRPTFWILRVEVDVMLVL
jgi:hypothetical protein